VEGAMAFLRPWFKFLFIVMNSFKPGQTASIGLMDDLLIGLACDQFLQHLHTFNIGQLQHCESAFGIFDLVRAWNLLFWFIAPS
jgi:hypothetical protein